MHNLTDTELDEALTAALRDGDIGRFEQLAAEADRRDREREQRLTSPGALAAAAEWYGANGIPIFPVQPRDKRPMPGCRWRDQATTNLDQIRRWWHATPQANIGAPTGIGFDVIDVDGPAGYQSFADLRDAGQIPALLGKAATPRGGMHLYIPPTGDGNATHVLPGIDFRGAGGYVVAAPSVGPNGRRYCWIVPIQLPAVTG